MVGLVDPKVRSDFPVLKDSIFLDCAYTGPLSLPVMRAGQDFLERRSRGLARNVEELCAAADGVRATVAELIHAKPTEIAFLTNTSEGTNIIATGLGLRQGDNVVTDDLDHVTNNLVWQDQQRRCGVENRVVHNREGIAPLVDFEPLADRRTRVISISHVSHRSGYRHDLRAMADLAHAHGALLHVDAAQSLGAVQLDVKGSGVDSLTCGTYKWLLGPLGLAVFYVREDLLPRLQPPFQGWMQVKEWDDSLHYVARQLFETARKYETGTMHFQGIYELGAALNYLKAIGMNHVEKQVLLLSLELRRGLENLGFHLITPPETQSGIVSCHIEHGREMARLLESNRIIASVGQARMRFSPHFFNTVDDISRVIGVLASR
jgi:cysteine desulfurase/selenocysteine lyase